jgi:DNA polymerase V
MFIIVDCNNFYVSCERVFNPKLTKKPVVVLSNNDGCIVARSNEIKNAGIKMGLPLFKVQAELDNLGSVILSSNYSLYGDMSRRVMQILASFTDEIEVYSIDEAFLYVRFNKPEECLGYAKEIQEKVTKATGIPISIGIGKTKSLAKLANNFVKQDGRKANIYNGIYILDSYDKNPDDVAYNSKVSELWGIGRQYTRKLEIMNINTVSAFMGLQDEFIQKNFSINSLNIKLELQGKIQYTLNEVQNIHSITSSLSFGQSISTKNELINSLTNHLTLACKKLRDRGLVGSGFSFFILTNRFKDDYYFGNQSVILEQVSNFTDDFTKLLHLNFDQIFKHNKEYKKSGIIIFGLENEDLKRPQSLFEEPKNNNKQKQLYQALDAINDRYGKNTVIKGFANLKTNNTVNKYTTKNQKRTPRYTTNIDELLEI